MERQAWVVDTLSHQGALAHLLPPREERKRGSVFMIWLNDLFVCLFINLFVKIIAILNVHAPCVPLMG